MTMIEQMGLQTSGKPISLAQLRDEIMTVGVAIDRLGMAGDYVYTYDESGEPCDFASADESVVQQAIADHVAMRNKTSDEYAAEFQDSATTAVRKQEIRDIQNGLLPPEQVPITQEEWDQRQGAMT